MIMYKELLAAGFAAVLAGPLAAADVVRGVTDHEIVIGTYTDLSGVTAMWGVNNSNAWRMVFDATNAAGGINGRKIRYIVEDSQYQVPRSVQAANKLINRDGVFIMVANGGTPMNNATMPEQLAKGVPNVFPLTSARSMYEPLNHLKFGLASSYYDQMRAGVKLFVEQRGKKTICAMSEDTDFGRDVMDGAREQLKAMNVKLAAETLHKPTDTDFSASVARLHDANCDLILVGGIVRDTVQIIAAVRKTGWNVDMLGQAASYDEAVAEVPGGVTEGFYSMTPVLYVAATDASPAVTKFAEQYKKLFGKEPNFAAQLGYTGAELVVEALKNAGKDLTAESFIQGMENIKDWHDIFGSPPMSFSLSKHQGSNESFLCVVKGGHWMPVSTSPVGY
jgi:branched-chain amino acid transport system substrate-binding protein